MPRARRTSVIVASLAWALAAPVTARAQLPDQPVLPPVLGAVQGLGPGTSPQLAASPAGELALGWARPTAGGGDELVVAVRAPAASRFGAPVPVARDPAGIVTPLMARSAAGVTAFAWTGTQVAPDGTRALRAVLVAPGLGAGPVEELPLPARRPPSPDGKDVVEASRGVVLQDVAVAADGAVAVAACETDYRVDPGGDGAPRALLWLRPAGSSPFGPPTVRDGCGTIDLAADGLGTILAVHPGPPDPTQPRNEPILLSERPAGGDFGPPQALSAPSTDNFVGVSPPRVLAAPGGRAVVFWGGGGAPFPRQVSVVARDAGGPWQPQQDVRASIPVAATGAINAAGAVAIVWSRYGSSLEGIFRPAAGTFSAPAFSAQLSPTGAATLPIAVDATGTAIVLRTSFEGPGARPLTATLRLPDGRFAEEIAVAPPGAATWNPTIATDAFGNGSAAWSVAAGDGREIMTRPYSVLPPMLADVAVGPSITALQVEVNEPVRVTLVASKRAGKTRRAIQRTQLSSGRTRVRLDRSMRSVLRARSPRLIVRAYDGGPRSSAVKARLPKRRARR